MNASSRPIFNRQTRVLFVAHGDPSRASSRLRVYNWLRHLERCGMQCRVVPYLAMRPVSGRCSRLADAMCRRLTAWTTIRRRILQGTKWADVVVIQEALLPLKVLQEIAASSARVVYDFSDPMHMAAPESSRLRKLHHQVITVPRFRRTLEIADHVIVENAVLSRLPREFGRPASIIAGPIDVERFRPQRIRSGNWVNLGWLGSPSTYKQLVPLLPTIDEVGRRCGNVRLTLLGTNQAPRLDHVQVHTVPWSLKAESRELPKFDVALCYLEMTPWTRARGGSKLLAYLAAGVPVVTSPAGIGDQVINRDCGFVATNQDQWRDVLCTLTRDAESRAELGQKARQQAVQRYSYEAQKDTLLSAMSVERIARNPIPEQPRAA